MVQDGESGLKSKKKKKKKIVNLGKMNLEAWFIGVDHAIL